jgi:Spy/CpxP family protein refolding chaperone
MSRSIIVSTIVVGVLGTFALAAVQIGSHGSHGAGSSAAHRRMHPGLEERSGVIAQGLGAGLAFPADQSDYPGPCHVLELKDVLGLTAEQELRMEELQTGMFAASRPASSWLLEAEARLRRLFADGMADEPGVRAAVAEAERAWAEVRLIHFLAHLQTRTVLTEEQRRLYRQRAGGQ